MTRGERTLRAAQICVLAGSAAAALVWSAVDDWRRLDVLALIVAFALIAELNDFQTKRVHLSASCLALGLAMVLLGPAPSALAASLLMLWDALRRNEGIRRIISNVSTWACWAVIGSIAFREFGGPEALDAQEAAVIPMVIGVYVLSNFVNFVLVAIDVAVIHGQSVWRSFRSVYLPVLPVGFAGGLLVAAVAYTDAEYGAGAIALVAFIGLVFQHIMKTAVQASERGEELEERNQELAALQFGLISTMLKTLSLRDNMTARHSAAVARYARAMAEELGMDEREQELIHTAALFHDIGKFIFPDSILLADRRLSDEDYEIVRKHPVVGADLIGEIEGYEEVAEIVRSHHERIDGRGYPDGLGGDDIPIGSRIIAVADVYDVLTARDTYRKPIPSRDALAELVNSANTQLDADIVKVFSHLVETRGVRFRHSTEADFEAELSLESRARAYAAPHPADSGKAPTRRAA